MSLTKIKDWIKSNIIFDFTKLRKEYSGDLKYISLIMYLYFFLVVAYYGGVFFLLLPIICFLDSVIDKKNSNETFVSIFRWSTWSIVIILLAYGYYLLLTNQ